MDDWLPLFPLKTVLFPDGVLPLKVFEARYIDMVRECMRKEAPFGVVLIRSGQEVGIAAEPEEVGCLARITDWDMPELGVMMLRTQGGERFRILETRVERFAPDPDIPVSDMHVVCAKALKLVIDDVESRSRQDEGAGLVSPFARPVRLDSARWVADRWCEILPISLKARQKLLELRDPASRLSIVHQYLVQHNIVGA